MLRTVRIALAKRAFEKADAEFRTYQSKPAGSAWDINVAVALGKRADRQAIRLANAIR